MANDPTFTPDDEDKLARALTRELLTNPPTIGLVGRSGTGKSSTINALFRTDLPVSHVVACTKAFRTEELRVEVSSPADGRASALLNVVDAPGLGEDVARDPKYLEMYFANLPRCDVILWVLTARDRALALDQMYLKTLDGFTERMIFGVNQIDLVEPLDWNADLNLPSVEQEKNISAIVDDRKARLEAVLGRPLTVIPYAARQKYNLQELFTALVGASPTHRAWLFTAIKAFRPDEFVPVALRDELNRRLGQPETVDDARTAGTVDIVEDVVTPDISESPSPPGRRRRGLLW